MYKVIQDIESEDRLIGFLTLKGFVYAAIALIFAFINFKLVTATGLGPLRWPFVLIFTPPMLLFGLLATPLGGVQSTEDWLIARLSFYFKPQRHTWDQSGLKELVTITAPKTEEKHYTDGLSQNEVKSRLEALAATLDSRGWAVKNVNVNTYSGPPTDQGSDRLVRSASLPQAVPTIAVRAEDDMLDPNRNVKAHQVDAMVQQKTAAYKKEILRKIDAARQAVLDAPSDLETLKQQNQAGVLTQPTTGTVARKAPKAPKPPAYLNKQEPPAVSSVVSQYNPEEQAILEEIHKHQQLDQEQKARLSSHLNTVLPDSGQLVTGTPPADNQPQDPAVTTPQQAPLPATPPPMQQPATAVVATPPQEPELVNTAIRDTAPADSSPQAVLPPVPMPDMAPSEPTQTTRTQPSEELDIVTAMSTGEQQNTPSEGHQAAIMDLAENRDLNQEITVATLSKEAERKLKQVQVNDDGEVVISLH